MRMLNQDRNNNKKKSLRKSQLLLIGSFLVFIGIFVLSYNHLVFLKDQVFANMEIAIAGLNLPTDVEEEVDVPSVDNVSDGTVYQQSSQEINYSKYAGVLEIPKIGLKRGFYNTDSKYNSIEYNVSVVAGSSMPNVANGNLMLMTFLQEFVLILFLLSIFVNLSVIIKILTLV